VIAAPALPLADHPLFVALPFVVPVVAIALGVLALSLRERRNRG
jgi:hypothetical protein